MPPMNLSRRKGRIRGKNNRFSLVDVKNVFIGDVMPFGAYPFCRLDFSNVTENVFSSVKIRRAFDEECCLPSMNSEHAIANKNYSWRLCLSLYLLIEVILAPLRKITKLLELM